MNVKKIRGWRVVVRGWGFVTRSRLMPYREARRLAATFDTASVVKE